MRNPQYDINKEVAKTLALFSGKMTNTNTLQVKKSSYLIKVE